MAVRSAEINVMAASAVKVARALARDFIELEQLQASEAGSLLSFKHCTRRVVPGDGD